MAEDADNNLIDSTEGDIQSPSVAPSENKQLTPPDTSADQQNIINVSQQVTAIAQTTSQLAQQVNINSEAINNQQTEIQQLQVDNEKTQKNVSETKDITDELVADNKTIKPLINSHSNELSKIIEILKNKTSSTNTPDKSAQKPVSLSNNPQLQEQIRKFILSVIPKNLKQQSKFKTNSKINEEVTPVTIKTFSAQANQQLINNIKQALQIKKQQDTFINKSNMIKLAILAVTGMAVYLLFKIKEVRDSFSNWIEKIEGSISEIKTTIVAWFTDIKNSFVNNVWTPLTEYISNISDTISSFVSKWYNKIVQPVIDYGKLAVTNFTDAYKKIKNFITGDFITFIADGWKNFKSWINEKLGFEVFKVEKEDTSQVQGITDETSKSDSDDSVSIPATSPSQSPDTTPLTNSQKIENNSINNAQNTTNAVENVNISGDKFNTTSPISNSIRLQNGNIINLNKDDDIYIANKPNGIIHSIFKEINANYSTVKKTFEEKFTQIIDNIKLQDKQLIALSTNLSNTGNITHPQVIASNLSFLQTQITKLQNPPKIITHSGIDNTRGKIRQVLQIS